MYKRPIFFCRKKSKILRRPKLQRKNFTDSGITDSIYPVSIQHPCSRPLLRPSLPLDKFSQPHFYVVVMQFPEKGVFYFIKIVFSE